jgi:hypothetical protein
MRLRNTYLLNYSKFYICSLEKEQNVVCDTYEKLHNDFFLKENISIELRY